MSWDIAYRSIDPPSALDIAAAALSAGNWAEMSPAPANMAAMLQRGSSNGVIMPFCNKGPWDALRKRFWILSSDHNDNPLYFVYYDEATNSFAEETRTGYIGHGYDHLNVNPYTGDLYYRRYGGGDFSTQVDKWNGSWSAIPSGSFFDDITSATVWWSGSLSGFGAQGALVNFEIGHEDEDGTIDAYDPLSNTWTNILKGYVASLVGNKSAEVGAYSSIYNCAVFGGGDQFPTKVWRLNSDATITAMPDTPSGKQARIEGGNLNVDPVTGKFLLLSATELWELNPSGSGTWTQQTGSRVPPAEVFNPTAPQPGMSFSLPEHGVVCYISGQGGVARMHLYKHA